MKNKIVALALAALLAPVAAAQYTDAIIDGLSVGQSVTDDTDPAMVCVYIGASGHGYVTVSAAGDLLFEAPDSTTADVHIECDGTIAADGSRNGTLDVSNAACDTFTDVMNIVNKPESDFRCALVTALGADTPGPSGTGFILAATDQLADSPNGYAVKFDTSAFWNINALVAPPNVYNKAPAWFNWETGHGVGKGGFITKPFIGQRAFLASAAGVSTYGSGASALVVYGVTFTNDYPYSETVRTLWPAATTPAGATTVAKVFGSCDTPATGCDPAWGAFGLKTSSGEKMIVRLTNTAAMASATLSINGSLYAGR